MRAAKEFIEEINQTYEAINKTKSQYLKNDYLKKVYSMQKELRTYCEYKHYDYNKLLKMIKV